MTTLTTVVKTIVENSISKDYLVECGYAAENILEDVAAIYEAEYGYNGVSPKACKDYLQGLPSVCTIPFYNGEILELLAQHGITRKTEAGQEALIDVYWMEAGRQFWKMIK